MDLFNIDTDDKKEQNERVTESVRMNEYVEPETTPVAGRVFDEMARVRDVLQTQYLSHNS